MVRQIHAIVVCVSCLLNEIRRVVAHTLTDLDQVVDADACSIFTRLLLIFFFYFFHKFIHIKSEQITDVQRMGSSTMNNLSEWPFHFWRARTLF